MSNPSPSPCPRCGTPGGGALAADGICPGCVLQDALRSDATLPGRPSLPEVRAALTQYDVREHIGQGGMGDVFRAEHLRLGRTVALKVLRPDLELAPEFAERFEREARAMARLQHPSIVTVHDFGEVDGLFYLDMEDVEGASMRALMQNGLSARDVVDFACQACDALDYAHERGVIHRDVKPENLLIDLEGRLRLVDFGLAKLEAGTVNLSLTGAHGRVGTPHYMAPEQIAGGEIDHRADLYSLGVVLYEALTKTLPIGRFKLPSELDAALAEFDEPVLRLLASEPAERFPSAAEAARALRAIGGSDAERTSVARAPEQPVEASPAASEPVAPPATDPVDELLTRADAARTVDERREACVELASEHGGSSRVREVLLRFATLDSDALTAPIAAAARDRWPVGELARWLGRLGQDPFDAPRTHAAASAAITDHFGADPWVEKMARRHLAGPAWKFEKTYWSGTRTLPAPEQLGAAAGPAERAKWALDVALTGMNFEQVRDLDDKLFLDEREAPKALALLASAGEAEPAARRLARDWALYGHRRWKSDLRKTAPREELLGTRALGLGWGARPAGRELLERLAGSTNGSVAHAAVSALLAHHGHDARVVELTRTFLAAGHDLDWADDEVVFENNGERWCRTPHTLAFLLEVADAGGRGAGRCALRVVAAHAADRDAALAVVDAWIGRDADDDRELGNALLAEHWPDLWVERAHATGALDEGACFEVGEALFPALARPVSGAPQTERRERSFATLERAGISRAEIVSGGRRPQRVLVVAGDSEWDFDPHADARSRRSAVSAAARDADLRPADLARIADLALNDADPAVRSEALRCVAWRQSDASESRALAAAALERETDPAARTSALAILNWLPDHDVAARDALLQCAREADTADLRRDALQALRGQAGDDPETHAALFAAAADDEHPANRAAALHGLARCAGTTERTLRRLLDALATDESRVVRLTAARELAFGWTGDPVVLAAVRERFQQESDEQVRAGLCRSVMVGWPDDKGARDWLLDLLPRNEPAHVLRAAVQALVYGWGDSAELEAALLERIEQGAPDAARRILIDALVRACPRSTHGPRLFEAACRRPLPHAADRREAERYMQEWIALRAQALWFQPDSLSWLLGRLIVNQKIGPQPDPSVADALVRLYPFDDTIALHLAALPLPALTPGSHEHRRSWATFLEAVRDHWGDEPAAVDWLAAHAPFVRAVLDDPKLSAVERRRFAALLPEPAEEPARGVDPATWSADELAAASDATLLLAARSAMPENAGGASLEVSGPGRVAALRTLGRRWKQDGPCAAETLEAFTRLAGADPDEAVRAQALGERPDRGSRAAREACMAAAREDEAESVRAQALRSLRFSAAESDVRAFLRERAVMDPAGGARAAAVRALVDVGSRPHDPADVDFIRERAARDESASVRRALVGDLGLRGVLDAAFLRDVVSGSDDRDGQTDVRLGALEALARDPDQMPLTWLGRLVASGADATVRARALALLAKHHRRDERAAQCARAALQDADAQVRQAAEAFLDGTSPAEPPAPAATRIAKEPPAAAPPEQGRAPREAPPAADRASEPSPPPAPAAAADASRLFAGVQTDFACRPAWLSFWPSWLVVVAFALASTSLRAAAESAVPALADAPALPPLGAALVFAQIVIRRFMRKYEIVANGDAVARVSAGIPLQSQRTVQLSRAQVDVSRSIPGFLLGYGTLRIWVGEQDSAAEWVDVARPFHVRDRLERARRGA